MCSRAIYRDNRQSYHIDYDPLYRLTDLIQGSSVLEHFDYDATGNRTAANIGGTAQSYAYPASSHRLQSVNGTSRDYDNAGNTTLRDGLSYTYNGRNRLSRVSMGRTTYYGATYNARGEREEKTLTAGMTTQRFIYDEAGRLIQTGNVPNIGLNRTLNPEQRLLWLDDQLVGVKLKTTSGTYPGELLYAHTDHLGTPRALTRSSNNSTVWRWPLETTAFGQHPAQTDPDGDGQALTFNLRYPGQYFDAESGLHYNYFRDYEAGVGRYIESDPIGLGGGISTYVYVGGSPLNFTDPTGLFRFGPSCNQQQRAMITQAMIDVLLDLAKQCAAGAVGDGCQKCEGCKYYSKLLDYFTSTVSFQCGGTSMCGQSMVNGHTALNPSLTMAPKPGCGCLKATIFHEAMHNMAPELGGVSDAAEERTKKAEKSCFTCGAGG